MHCRFCQTKLEEKVIDLENSPPANAYLTDPNSVELYYPLQVFVCKNCFLVQTLDYVSPSSIFNKDYAFISSASQTWKKHCEEYAVSIISKLNLQANSTIVEIGSNDGILMRSLADKGMNVFGIDPAASVEDYKSYGLQVLDTFFTLPLAEDLVEKGKKADLIIANNVIAHVPDINDFVKGIKTLLSPEGIATIELPHLLSLMKFSQFDTIYHEHFSYFSVTVLNAIFKQHHLEIIDVEKLSIHGGSLRVYITHQENDKYPVGENVYSILEEEKNSGVETPGFYQNLQDAAFKIKSDFLFWLMNMLHQDKKIMLYGAAAKGNTFLNYCGVKKDMIPFIADVTQKKQDKYLPGSHIKIVSESAIAEYKPDFIVVLPWNYKTEIDEKLDYTKQWGCKLIYAIPGLTISRD